MENEWSVELIGNTDEETRRRVMMMKGVDSVLVMDGVNGRDM
jgi:hypothetical protein